jgi:nitrous oxidase accessory protein NosD
MKRKFSLLALILLPAALASGAQGAPTVWDTPTISSDTTWSGDIVIRQNVVVTPGATLRVAAGTNVLVTSGKGIGISVLGRLVVAGKESEPVSFVPEKGGSSRNQWEGIRLAGGRNAGHALSGFRLSGAREGISLTETAAKISGAVISGCEAGLRWNQKTSVTVDNCTFDGNGDGAFLSFGGEGVFRDCRFVNVQGNGIVVDKGAVLRVAGSTFSHGRTGIFSLTNSPCRIEDSAFTSLEKGIVARQMGKNSTVARCSFENDDTGLLAVQNSLLEVQDSVFLGNRTGLEVQEFSSPGVRNNRFERNQVALSVIRKSRPAVERSVFYHNRTAVVVNYSSYPRIAGNNFDRNDMSVRLEKFQSGDWEERAGSRQITGAELARRSPPSQGMGQMLQEYTFSRRIEARGNFWGPDPERDFSRGTLGKIWDGKKFGPVRYEGSGDEEFAIDEVDFAEEAQAPFPEAGPRAPGGTKEAR